MTQSIDFIEGGHVTTPRGFLAGAVSAGLKTAPGALDLCLLLSERSCSTAGVFTQNLVKGAPVIVSRERVAAGRVRAVVVNSGCSNSLNGPGGYEDAVEMTRLAAAHLGLDAEEVAVASTGVTGVRLPMAKVRSGIAAVAVSAQGGADFARAIMTTDTRPKEAAVRVSTTEGAYTLGGCIKGSGMIHPNMATMLCYVTTDAAVEPGFLAAVQREVADETLNMVSIDGDTSCSDTFLILANGAAELPVIEAGTLAADEFQAALYTLCRYLARELARDGEGARRLIEVVVSGAPTVADARLVARTVSNSPLVKTAVAGCDPNWGRILVAAGRSGAPIEEQRTAVSLQGVAVFRGVGLDFDERALSDSLDAEEVSIEIDLGAGEAAATAWGCDLTVDYVHINADYRT